VLSDLCVYIEGDKTQFLQLKSISPAFILELIESILLNNTEVFRNHPEQGQILRQHLMPLITKLLSDRLSFSITVRVARILFLLLKRHLNTLSRECELALVLLTHLLEPDASTPWKRILAMEIFRGLYADYGLIRTIYALYDQQVNRKNILQNQMGAMVRIASEKPSLIGVSRQSTMPSSQASTQSIVDEQATLEAGGVAGVIGTPVTIADSNTTGISAQWSNIRTPCIDQLDKSEPQGVPDTYIYTLILNSISTLSEGLAKFILPLTVPSEGRGKRRHRFPIAGDQDPTSPVEPGILQRIDSTKTDIQTVKRSQIPLNPLDLESHPQFQSIRISASILESVWTAVLATCSTFFNAALDSEFYHNLVRSFQKLAHVAGLLRLSTPRDAFLTTLGKAAVPSEAFAGGAVPPTPGPDADRKHLTVDGPVVASPASASPGPRRSFEGGGSSLSTRNLLCLRALLNLGIALGPTLDEAAWAILLETLQQADLVIVFSMRMKARQSSISQEESDPNADQALPRANLGTEVMAVETAATRMFESTSEYPNDCFLYVLNALLKLSGHVETQSGAAILESKTPTTPRTPTIAKRPGRMHQGNRSISISLTKTKIQNDEMAFVLTKTDQLLEANIGRFSSSASEGTGWNLLTNTLLEIMHSLEVESSSRLKAADVLNRLIVGSMGSVLSEEPSLREEIQLRAMATLEREVITLGRTASGSTANRNTELGIHDLALISLKSILEQCGESLVAGWETVFELICSVFDKTDACPASRNGAKMSGQDTALSTKSPTLVRTAFSSLQLVGSDFLELLPISCLSRLIDSLPPFCLQQDDFNISLTTTNFFWNVSDFLQVKIKELTFDTEIAASGPVTDGNSASWSALWLCLLLRMKVVTTDSRPEIRNGAIHTMYRIFDANGRKLSPTSWHHCLDTVLFPMLETGQEETVRGKGSSENSDSQIDSGWKDTMVLMIKGLANLISTFLEDIDLDPSFPESWDRMLKFLRCILSLESLELSAAVFSSLKEILKEVQRADTLGDRPLQTVWRLWDDANPAMIPIDMASDNDNQEVLSSYLRTYSNLYRLSKENLNAQHVNSIIKNLQLCVWKSFHARYATDVNKTTPVQEAVLDSLKSIMREIEGSQSIVINCCASFADSAFALSESSHGKPTFIGLSKASIDLLDWAIAYYGIQEDIFSNGALSTALSHLSTPITQKYSWKGKDKIHPMWQKATTSSLKILETSIPYISTLPLPEDETIATFWTHVITIVRGILSADCTLAPSRSTILADQAFDTEAFLRLHKLIDVPLSSPSIPDSIRSSYASTLFTASFIHPLHRHDLPQSLSTFPLSSIYTIRMGRTIDPPPTPRTGMSYTALTTLFSLVSSINTSTDPDRRSVNITLARAISPYLILRAALPLKAYVADQPLRGLMPQPLSQRKELLFVLRQLVELRSVDDAVPASADVEGVRRGGKRHLWWVMPLVERAIGVAGRDVNGEVLGALRRVVEVVVRGI
jgi:hypothetical protein